MLPERGGVQRLRPTENGRSLHVAGTITGRRVSQPIEPHPLHPPHQSLPGFVSPMSPQCLAHPHGPPPPLMHSNSMTHLHQQCVVHPSPAMDPSRSGSMHELRFGYPPSKVYTSEPDLRVGGNSVQMPAPHSPHTIVSQSPTKGRIKSKKRNRAPPPPSNGALSDGYVHDNSRANSESQRAVHWGTSDTHSRPPSQVSSSKSKSKSKKVGLFKKKNDGRKSDAESYFTEDQSKSKYSRSQSSEMSKKEKRERARSVDCLQHELRHSTSGHNGEISIPGSSSDETSSSSPGKDHRPRSQTIERDSRRFARDESDDRRLSTTMERNPRHHIRDGSRKSDEFRPHSRLEERRSHEYGGQYASSYGQRHPSEKHVERRASYSVSRHEKIPINKAFEEWEKAEREELRRKKIPDHMKHEILSVAKNLKRSSLEQGVVKIEKVEESIMISPEKLQPSLTEVNSEQDTDVPKTFFFGMEPSGSSSKSPISKVPSTRIVQTEEVRIEGNTVEFSKRNAEVIQRSRSQSRIRKPDNAAGDVVDNGRISNDVDEFAIAMHRRKRSSLAQDNIMNNSLKREDGGYHSRQNSGSFHLGNENPSDEDLGVTVNLRPILPKRQREIPRFSPNAAWRFLGEEPLLPGENLNESRSSEEVDAVFEDKIRGYSRPVAPPRGSGEKSADSGISGDAGSPGPMQEFEAIKIVAGPLAASSPVASGRSDIRRARAWTPAQDLDDNSLDGSAAESPAHRSNIQHDKLNNTPPKLTSRANMFNLFGLKEGRTTNGYSSNVESSPEFQKQSTTMDESTQTMSHLRKLKRSISGSANVISNSNNISNSRNPVNEKNIKSELSTMQNDKWRENWSMTRSIPNSLNNYKESESLAKRDGRTGEDLPNSQYRRMNSEGNAAASGQLSSSHLQGSPASGHIMYLPEYNSLKVQNEDAQSSGEIKSRDLNSSKHLSRSYAQDKANDEPNKSEGPVSMPQFFPSYSPVGRLKKGKKFSYQSTVRVLEKRKIEAKLNKEVAEKEQQRLQEAAAMRQVRID